MVEETQPTACCRAAAILIWLALITGFGVSVFTVIEELCLATACRDTASFTFFGIGMGWFGIAYFLALLVLRGLRGRVPQGEALFSAFIFLGVGAEFRLLWLQKFVIGGWCPLCVTVCCALFAAAGLLVVEKVSCTATPARKALPGWFFLIAVMAAMGLAIAMAGVRELA